MTRIVDKKKILVPANRLRQENNNLFLLPPGEEVVFKDKIVSKKILTLEHQQFQNFLRQSDPFEELENSKNLFLTENQCESLQVYTQLSDIVEKVNIKNAVNTILREGNALEMEFFQDVLDSVSHNNLKNLVFTYVKNLILLSPEEHMLHISHILWPELNSSVSEYPLDIDDITTDEDDEEFDLLLLEAEASSASESHYDSARSSYISDESSENDVDFSVSEISEIDETDHNDFFLTAIGVVGEILNQLVDED